MTSACPVLVAQLDEFPSRDGGWSFSFDVDEGRGRGFPFLLRPPLPDCIRPTPDARKAAALPR